MWDEIQPWHFVCADCASQPREKGFEWACGHRNCCLPRPPHHRRCTSPFCKETRLQGQDILTRIKNPIFIRDSAPYQREGQIMPCCPTHPEAILEMMVVRTEHGFLARDSCAECDAGLPEKWVDSLFMTSYSQLHVAPLAQAYRRVEELLAKAGIDLGFRDLLDQALFEEIEGMYLVRKIEAIKSEDRFFLAKTPESGSYLYQSHFLNRVTYLLQRLGGAWRRHPEKRAIASLLQTLDFNADENDPRTGMIFRTATSYSEMTLKVKGLLCQQFPFPKSPPVVEVDFWRFRRTLTDNRLIFQDPKIHRSRQKVALEWFRAVRRWRSFSEVSQVTRRRDSLFLTSLFPGHIRSSLMRRVTEDSTNWDGIRFDLKDSINQLLLFRAGPNRFGLFNLGTWPSNKASQAGTRFFFSLNDPRKFEVSPRLVCANRSSDWSELWEPVVASSLKRKARSSPSGNQNQFHKQSTTFSISFPTDHKFPKRGS